MISTTTIFIILFLALSLQAFITILQVKNYRQSLKDLSGKGIVGVGHTKGFIRPGEIILLKYDRKLDKVINCRVMKGRTVLARFKSVDDYNDMSLEEIRKVALELDQKVFKRRRKKHPYDPEELTKKKHALIQAIENIDHRLSQPDREIKVTRKKGETVGLSEISDS